MRRGDGAICQIESATGTVLVRYGLWAAGGFLLRRSETKLDQVHARFTEYDCNGMRAGNSKVLSMLLERRARTYEEFVSRLLLEHLIRSL
jgi:hypothetical protein